MPRAGSRCAGSPPRRSRLPPGRAAAPRGGRRCCWARRSGSGAAALCRCHPRAAPPAPACAAAPAPGALKAVHSRQCLGSQHLCCQGLELQTMLRLPQVHMHPPNLPQRYGALCSSTAQGTTRLLRPAGAPGGRSHQAVRALVARNVVLALLLDFGERLQRLAAPAHGAQVSPAPAASQRAQVCEVIRVSAARSKDDPPAWQRSCGGCAVPRTRTRRGRTRRGRSPPRSATHA